MKKLIICAVIFSLGVYTGRLQVRNELKNSFINIVIDSWTKKSGE